MGICSWFDDKNARDFVSVYQINRCIIFFDVCILCETSYAKT